MPILLAVAIFLVAARQPAGPGHGASSDPGRRYTLEECAEAARTVLDALGITGPVDWVGNAWGGHVGAVFAAKWPGRCRTLVTVGTPVQALSPLERARTLFLLAAYRLQARAASHLLPHGASAVVANAAYLAPLEAPRETARLVRQFWATQLTATEAR